VNGSGARCRKCGRPVASARALQSGYGERCRRRLNRAERVLAASASGVARKAAEILEDGAAVPHGHARVWRVVSSNGVRQYLAHPNGCTCPAGLHQVMCCHRVAVTLLAC